MVVCVFTDLKQKKYIFLPDFSRFRRRKGGGGGASGAGWRRVSVAR